MRRLWIAIVGLAAVLALTSLARTPVAARGPIATLATRETRDRPWRVDAHFDGLTFARVGEDFEHRAAVFLDSAHELVLPGNFMQSGWMNARPMCGAIYAVADVDVESPGHVFELVKKDSERWLHIASIPKPHYTAYFEGLTCENGVLTLRAAYDTEVARSNDWISRLKRLVSRQPRGEVTVLWRSGDGGRTWRGPRTIPATP